MRSIRQCVTPKRARSLVRTLPHVALVLIASAPGLAVPGPDDAGVPTVPGASTPTVADTVRISREPAVAVLPPVNLSGVPLDLRQIETTIREGLRSRGVPVLDRRSMDALLARNRIRYTGGISSATARAFREDAALDAVLITSVDLFTPIDPPKIALTARLVSTDGDPAILWMDSVTVAGNQAPGVLGLGWIRDPGVIRETALAGIVDSAAGFISGDEDRRPSRRAKRKFRPKTFHRSPRALDGAERTLRVAVLPFLDESTTRHAGEILTLQFVRHLRDLGRVEVVEPGEIRQALLQGRVIREGGVSLPQVDLLRVLLEVDFVLTGTVREYREGLGPAGNPRVAFSVRGIDPVLRQVVWASFSYNDGYDRVWFFDLGTVSTAHELASEMSRAVLERVLLEAGSTRQARSN